MPRLCTRCGVNLVFGTDKKTGLGYCKNHQYLRTDLDKRTPLQKALDKKVSEGNNPTYNKKNDEINDWFQGVFRKEFLPNGCKCWECGEPIPEKFFRHATAHILPKAYFPSVATHPMNYLILGATCGCHSKYDTSWKDASKMNIWGIAVARFQEIYPYIASASETRRLPDILLNTLAHED